MLKLYIFDHFFLLSSWAWLPSIRAEGIKRQTSSLQNPLWLPGWRKIPAGSVWTKSDDQILIMNKENMFKKRLKENYLFCVLMFFYLKNIIFYLLENH